jgi:N-acetylglucosamine kinase-like BadF-type ATPase
MTGVAPSRSPGAAPTVALALDGGASKTDAVVVDNQGRLLGRARGGPSNHQMVGLDEAMANLEATVVEAADAAGIPSGARPVATVASYCLAGLDLAVDEARLSPAIAQRQLSEAFTLRNDTFAILRAGVTSGFGIAVVCGTGLNCVGLGRDGTTVRFPSLGELSGDFTPGGAWLGVRGLGLALRAADGRGRPTSLATLVPQHLGAADAGAVLDAVYRGDISYARLPELAEVVLEAAKRGDLASQSAVGQLVDEVVAMVGAAIDRLGLADQAVEVVAGGGLFEDRGFEDQVMAGVRARCPGATVARMEGPPVLGAALFALDELGAPPGAEERLRAALG